MMMGLAWTAIVALFAAASVWPAAAAPVRAELAVRDAVIEADGRRHRHHGHRHRHHHHDYNHRYRPGWGYWPHPGHYQPPYYLPPRYYEPPRHHYAPHYYYRPNPGFYFYYRN